MRKLRTFAVRESTLVNDIFRKDEAVFAVPDELLRANLLITILLCAPPRREGSPDEALPATGGYPNIVVQGWDVVLPPFAGAKAARGGVPLCRDELGA